MSTYEVKATPVGAVWHVEVPAIGRVTQARHAREIEAMAKDLIAIFGGDDESQIVVEVSTVLPSSVEQHLARAAELRETEAAARRDAAAEVRLAASELKSQGLSLRDIGTVLGVSHQRAGQLVG